MNDFPVVFSKLFWLEPNGMISRDKQPADFDDWLEFGEKLWAVRKAVKWALGDWIIYGEVHYGEKYAQAEDITKIAYGTLQNYVWVSKRFEMSRRRDNLSWSHHREVAGIPDEQEQDALLDIAESQQMGRDELRDVVKRYKQPDSLLVVGEEAPRPPYIIKGEIVWDGWNNLFVPDDGVEILPGKYELHRYEEGE